MRHFFEPPSGGGTNDYAFVANRLFGGVQHTTRAYDATAALQYVHSAGRSVIKMTVRSASIGLAFDFARLVVNGVESLYAAMYHLRLRSITPTWGSS